MIHSNKRPEHTIGLDLVEYRGDKFRCRILSPDVSRIVSGISGRKWTATQIVTAFIEQATDGQDVTSSWTKILFESALKVAKELDHDFNRTGKLLGPLHGVPLIIHDQCDACPCLQHASDHLRIPIHERQDSEIIAHMRSLGGIVIGKTNLNLSENQGETDWVYRSDRRGLIDLRSVEQSAINWPDFHSSFEQTYSLLGSPSRYPPATYQRMIDQLTNRAHKPGREPSSTTLGSLGRQTLNGLKKVVDSIGILPGLSHIVGAFEKLQSEIEVQEANFQRHLDSLSGIIDPYVQATACVQKNENSSSGLDNNSSLLELHGLIGSVRDALRGQTSSTKPYSYLLDAKGYQSRFESAAGSLRQGMNEWVIRSIAELERKFNRIESHMRGLDNGIQGLNKFMQSNALV